MTSDNNMFIIKQRIYYYYYIYGKIHKHSELIITQTAFV